jgi:hypothetical protein
MELDTNSFVTTAVGAFPPHCEPLARAAALALSTSVDPHYSGISTTVEVHGQPVKIPQRLYFQKQRLESLNPLRLEPMSQCLLTRSTDGHQRHAALRSILPLNESWSIPFVILLAGEYVVEIVDEIVGSLAGLDRAAYVSFVLGNTQLMLLLKARATSYWSCYYRHFFRDRHQYPGLRFLEELEKWASCGTDAAPSR